MIHERLAGGWRLVKFEAWQSNGRIYSPMGRGAQRYILCSANGLVSVSLSRGDHLADPAARGFS